MLRALCHQGNANQNYIEILSYSAIMAIIKKKTASVIKDRVGKEPLCSIERKSVWGLLKKQK
jgi:hypothetical protein